MRRYICLAPSGYYYHRSLGEIPFEFAERRLKMKNQPLLLIMAGVNLPINVFLRWCCSTGHKDIGTMYFTFFGALTNKLHSFKGRPWELSEVRCRGISDTLGFGLRVNLRRGTNKILNLVPVFLNEIGTKFISDFTRYSVEGFLLDRVNYWRFGLFVLGLSLSLSPYDFLSYVLLFKDLIVILDRFFLLSGSFISVTSSYTSVTDLLFFFFKNSEWGPNQYSPVSSLIKIAPFLYPFLYGSGLFCEALATLGPKTPAPFKGLKSFSLKGLRGRYFNLGADFSSEFPSLISKVFISFFGYINNRNAFFLGLLSGKIKSLFFLFKKGLGLSVLTGFLEGRYYLCKSTCKIANYFLFFSMLLECRFDKSLLYSFMNFMPFIKNSSGVLSSVSSEASFCCFFVKKEAILRRLGLFNTTYSLYSLKHVFGWVGPFLPSIFYFSFCNLKKRTLILIGEVSEKGTFIFNLSGAFLRIHLSVFNSRATKLQWKRKIALGKLVLPLVFLLEKAFGFISTLGYYKKSPLIFSAGTFLLKRSPLSSLLRLGKGAINSFCFFVFCSNESWFKSTQKSSPLYVHLGVTFLTEIVSISKENLIEEDSFLKKSPKLVYLSRLFRLGYSSFNE